MWPYGDLGIALHSGDGLFKSIGVNVGLWNSLHTGDCRARRPQREALVRIRLLRDVRARFREGTSLGVTYTAYTSPNGLFNTVRELSFKFALDDSGALGRAATKPYVLVARELDGQADGGVEEGTYLESAGRRDSRWAGGR